MTYHDKASCGSTPPCTHTHTHIQGIDTHITHTYTEIGSMWGGYD